MSVAGIGMPPLVAVGHGSRDPRSAASITSLLGVLRSARPWLDVRPAFLDLSAPRLTDVLDAVQAEGHFGAVVVPLLLGSAYHARVDVPATVRDVVRRHPRMRIGVTDVLGPDDRLEMVALRRLVDAGASVDDRGLGVIVAATGSSHPQANDAVAGVAQRWERRYGWAGVSPAFAAAAQPDVAAAVRSLRECGARRIAVASWFLAPGLLPDRIIDGVLAEDPAAVIADPLGTAAEVADVIVDRYSEAATAGRVRRGA
ncbi:MAG: sirohydrochlorin chelatase [Sciscionella sp.]